MKKSELIDAVAEKASVSKKEVENVLDAFQEVVLKTCVNDGEEVNLPMIGKFKQKVNPARKGINPLNKKSIDIPESHTLTFKAIKSVKKIIGSDKKKK